MKTGIKIVLWVVVAVFAWIAVDGFSDSPGLDAAGRGLSQAVGTVFGWAAAAAGEALLLGMRWRGWLYVAGVILLLPFLLIGAFVIEGNVRSAQDARNTADVDSGRADFPEQPALLAVANAIDRNDEGAIRAAVNNVPDLQAAGREGKTLLYFAVEKASVRPELVKAVATLLSCGADPNYNNGQPESFAMWRASTGDVRVLRALLDAGGNPNGLDFRGEPIIFEVLNGGRSEDCRDRLRVLLDRGADVNSTLPDKAFDFAGYTLLLRLTFIGGIEPAAYSDALDLLERGADFNRTAQDRMTVVKMLAKQRRDWSASSQAVPPDYEKLCDWLRQHGAILEDA
jgi:hypothetical protein